MCVCVEAGGREVYVVRREGEDLCEEGGRCM